MDNLDVSGYTSWASFLIIRMSVSGRLRREWVYQGIEMPSLGTVLQALPWWQTPILHAADDSWWTDRERKRVGKDG